MKSLPGLVFEGKGVSSRPPRPCCPSSSQESVFLLMRVLLFVHNGNHRTGPADVCRSGDTLHQSLEVT